MSSRWNKSRPQSQTLPLDALLKENEHANRPVHAARSAGTVGKWGTTSFTSIRDRPIYGFASFSPNQDTSFQYPSISAEAPVDGPQMADATVVPKPKKFFKSRNSVPDTDVVGVAALAETPIAITAMSANASAAALAIVPHPHPTTSKISIKNKKNAEGTTRKTKAEKAAAKEEKAAAKAEKPEKVEKQPRPEKKTKVKKRAPKVEEKPAKVVPEVKPTRVLSRTRKAVNYSEDKSRSPSPKRLEVAGPTVLPPPLPSVQNDLETSPIHQAHFNSDGEPFMPIESHAINHLMTAASPPSTSKTLATDHPPIVLRISKGTSRLVSTDSEGINNSPPYLSPIQQQQQLPNFSYTSAAASLVAVLSDELSPQIPNHIDTAVADTDVQLPTPAKSKPKSRKAKVEPIKKTKTNAKLKNNIEKANVQEIVKPKTTRSSRQQRATAVAAPPAAKEINSDIPEIGTANYELYRALTAEEKDFDVQNPGLDASLVSPEANQSDSTQSAAAVDTQLAVLHSETAQISDETPVSDSIAPKKRGTRAKAKPENSDQVLINVVQEEPVPKKIRGRRNQVVEPIPVAEAAGRRRITAAAKKHYTEPELPPVQPIIAEIPSELQPIQNLVPAIEVVNEVPQPKTRGRRGKKAAETPAEPIVSPPPPPTRSGRATRHNTNGSMMQQENETKIAIPTVTRSYGRKRKQPNLESTPASTAPVGIAANVVTDESSLMLPDTEPARQNININLPFAVDETMKAATTTTEAKIPRTKIRRSNQNGTNAELANISNNNDKSNNLSFAHSGADATDDVSVEAMQPEVEKPSVKLVISKKKGSIFKSRAIDSDSGDSGQKQKRHVYKHKWDDDLSEEKTTTTDTKAVPADEDPYADDIDMEAPIAAQIGPNAGGTSKFSRQTRANVPDDDLRIRNVKKAHQMQEIGETQEMDDDVEYILESLKSQNPIATRSLAAIQLASKCMTPAFRMHVRAHGTATKFFGALHDATQYQSLGLCTATIMFVLIQDNLNMDLDKHSLELMLNLLDSDISQKNNYKDSGLTDEQSQRNEQKVIEICREIKSQGKAVHLNLENISIGTLAMETLLTLTSKRAGDWFKDELRQLGGLEHIINTICECCKQISDCVVEWTEPLLEKLRKIERCLRVLENVSERNEDNQTYILCLQKGHAVETLVNFYKLCDNEIVLYPTKDASMDAANNPGVVLREALVPTLKVLINLTHTFHGKPMGSILFGEKPVIFDTSFHLLFQAPNYVPEKCIFELSLLVLLLLINLTVHSVPNRKMIMEATLSSESRNRVVKGPAIKALIEYFYKYEEMARFVEQNTDAILDNPEKSEKAKHKSQEEIEETVSTLLQRAGNHMEHTMLASYVCLLVGHLVMDCKENEAHIREYLRTGTFEHMVQILEKYYNFMNLTASSEAIQVAHMKETKRIIQFMKNSDVRSTTDDEQPGLEPTYSTKSTLGTNSKVTDTTTRLASNNTTTISTSDNSSTSNSMFNRVYFSGR